MLKRIILAAAVVLLAHEASAQDSSVAKPKTAALAGMVRDPFGKPIIAANVSVDGRALSSVTNDSGYFFLKGVSAGPSDFSVTKLGYLPVHFRIDLAPDTTLMVNIPMKSAQTLPTVDVKGEQVSPKLLRAGYYERRNLGLGSFIGPDKIEKLSMNMDASAFLRDVRNTRVICRSSGLPRCFVRMGSKVDVTARQLTGCSPVIYVNGSKRTGELDEVVAATEVYAMEVYERRAVMPMQYQPAECAIGVWTKTFADVPERKP